MLKGTAIGGATYTASVGFSSGGFNNWSWGGFARSAGIGGISGMFAFGIGESFNGIGGIGEAFVRAGAHGIVNMQLGASFGGGGYTAGSFLTGLGGSLMGSVTHTWGTNAQIASSTMFAGLASELSGGGFWRGAASGAIISGLNHAAHNGIEYLVESGTVNINPVNTQQPTAWMTSNGFFEVYKLLQKNIENGVYQVKNSTNLYGHYGGPYNLEGSVPISNLDYNFYIHDKNYEKFYAAGPSDAFLNFSDGVIAADALLSIQSHNTSMNAFPYDMYQFMAGQITHVMFSSIIKYKIIFSISAKAAQPLGNIEANRNKAFPYK
ncbi:MAG: hypothetical protein SFU91_05390 [Chloroherpetonaceae bacterium]|nr:hypothetical protein [Chloroherpetonaceae bacterium]